MSDPTPRLYLNTPLIFEPKPFADELAHALDAGDVACVRLRLKGASADELRFAIDALAPICHSRDTALILADHWRLAKEMGLDGVHLEENRTAVREARAELGPDAIVGASCGASRDAGMRAGEVDASYVSFGPIVADPALEAGDIAPLELFAWWQQMIEIPVVAEGGVTPEAAEKLAPYADFIAASKEVWKYEDGPAAAVRRYLEAISRGLEERGDAG
ncbi:MAG: thiamine phosphate synthase [Neomegalonema sp.]|nr:thiamine phosphate synthase [Neomegalonema sp.]